MNTATRKSLGSLLLLAISMLLSFSSFSKEEGDSLCVYFKSNVSDIDTLYRSNGPRMRAFADRVRSASEAGELSAS